MKKSLSAIALFGLVLATTTGFELRNLIADTPNPKQVKLVREFLDETSNGPLVNGQWTKLPRNRWNWESSQEVDATDIVVTDHGVESFWGPEFFSSEKAKISSEFVSSVEKYIASLRPTVTKGYYWKPLPQSVFAPDEFSPKNLVRRGWVEAHPSYPNTDALKLIYMLSLVNGKLVRFITYQEHAPTLLERKISVSQAISVALAAAKNIRKNFPRSAKTKPIIGPKSPVLVIHYSNRIFEPEFVASVKKAGWNSTWRPFLPGDESGFEFKKKPESTGSQLCWLVNINGDICAVNAATGKLHCWVYAEQGAYFTISPNGTLTFDQI